MLRVGAASTHADAGVVEETVVGLADEWVGDVEEGGDGADDDGEDGSGGEVVEEASRDAAGDAV